MRRALLSNMLVAIRSPSAPSRGAGHAALTEGEEFANGGLDRRQPELGAATGDGAVDPRGDFGQFAAPADEGFSAANGVEADHLR